LRLKEREKERKRVRAGRFVFVDDTRTEGRETERKKGREKEEKMPDLQFLIALLSKARDLLTKVRHRRRRGDS